MAVDEQAMDQDRTGNRAWRVQAAPPGRWRHVPPRFFRLAIMLTMATLWGATMALPLAFSARAAAGYWIE